MDEAGGVSSLTAGTGENVSSNEENGRTETLPQISVLPHIRCRNLWIMTSS